MEVLPIDLNAVLGITLGSLVVLIPLAGLTLRFAIKPLVEAIARARGSQSAAPDLGRLEKRLAALEERMGTLDGTVDRLVEEREFHRELGTPRG